MTNIKKEVVVQWILPLLSLLICLPTMTSAISPPSNLRVIEVANNMVTLGWTGPIEGADWYDAKISPLDEGEDAKPSFFNNSYVTWTSLVPGKEYTVKVRSMIKHGDPSWPAIVKFVTVPSTPFNVKISKFVNPILNQYRVTGSRTMMYPVYGAVVSWQQPGDGYYDDFVVTVDPPHGNVRVPIKLKTGIPTTQPVEQRRIVWDLLPGVLYKFAVQSKSNGVMSDAIIGGERMPPEIPASIKVEEVGPTHAKLSWLGEHRGILDGYTVETDPSGGVVEQTTNPAKKSRIIRNLTPGTKYKMDVYSTKEGLLSFKPRSTELYTPPATPLGDVVTTESKIESIAFSWKAPPGKVEYYDIVYYPSNRDFGRLRERVTDTKVNLTTLDPGSAYKIQIFAISNKLESPPLKATVYTRPVPPTNVITTATHDSITISWESVYYDGGAKVVFRPVGETDESATITNIDSRNSEYTIKDLTAETAYIVEVINTKNGVDSVSVITETKTSTETKAPPPSDNPPISAKTSATEKAVSDESSTSTTTTTTKTSTTNENASPETTPTPSITAEEAAEKSTEATEDTTAAADKTTENIEALKQQTTTSKARQKTERQQWTTDRQTTSKYNEATITTPTANNPAETSTTSSTTEPTQANADSTTAKAQTPDPSASTESSVITSTEKQSTTAGNKSTKGDIRTKAPKTEASTATATRITTASQGTTKATEAPIEDVETTTEPPYPFPFFTDPNWGADNIEQGKTTEPSETKSVKNATQPNTAVVSTEDITTEIPEQTTNVTSTTISKTTTLTSSTVVITTTPMPSTHDVTTKAKETISETTNDSQDTTQTNEQETTLPAENVVKIDHGDSSVTLKGGFKTICEPHNITVLVDKAVIGKYEELYGPLHLNDDRDPSCRGIEYDTFFRYTIAPDILACGTMFVVNETHVNFTNTVSNQRRQEQYYKKMIDSSGTVMVGSRGMTPLSLIHMGIVCTFPLDITISTDYAFIPNIVIDVARFNVSGKGQFSAIMQLYKDRNYQSPHFGAPSLRPDDTLRVGVTLLETKDDDIYISVRKCWATPVRAHDFEQFYPLIEDYCPVTGSLKGNLTILENGNSKRSRWQGPVFKFVKYEEVWLHCELKVCFQDFCNKTCDNGRSKRSAWDKLNIPAVVSAGPIYIRPDGNRETTEVPGKLPSETGKDNLEETTIIIIVVILSIVIFVSCILFIFVLTRCRRRKSKQVKTSLPSVTAPEPAVPRARQVSIHTIVSEESYHGSSISWEETEGNYTIKRSPVHQPNPEPLLPAPPSNEEIQDMICVPKETEPSIDSISQSEHCHQNPAFISIENAG